MLYCNCNNLPHPLKNCPILSRIEDANNLANVPPPADYILTQEQRDARFENGWRRRIDNGSIVFYQIDVAEESNVESDAESDAESDVESSDDVVIVSRQNNKTEAVRELADLVDALSDKMESDAYRQLMDLCGKLYNT
jgi:hypothetical protein